MRVSPVEVYIKDIEVYNQVIDSQQTNFMKAPYFYEPFNNPGTSVFSERDKEINPYDSIFEESEQYTCFIAHCRFGRLAYARYGSTKDLRLRLGLLPRYSA